MRPLTPIPIVVWSAVGAALLWSSERLDDMAGCTIVVTIAHLLLWLGLRGDLAQPASRGGRVELAIGGALPGAALLLAAIPWFAPAGGMEALGTVLMMLIFGVPLGVAALAVVMHRLTRDARCVALRRIVVIVAAATALAWVLALVWGTTRADPGDDTTTVLVFPALATWWLLLASAELLVGIGRTAENSKVTL
jgi:hypothetical protein